MAARLVLASGSPQRRAILEQLGVSFDVEVPEVEELSDGVPAELVRENAARKARAVARERGAACPVLGADTVVSLGGRPLGKPRDEDEAERFLRDLSGRWHEVHSGLALVEAGGEAIRSAVTRVRFRELGRADLDWYLRSGEWRERAGGYAIQGLGAALVEGIEGDYWNVVGLPVPLLIELAPWLIRP